MKARYREAIALTAVVLLFTAVLDAGAKKRPSPLSPVQKTTGTPVVTYFDINNISTVLRNNGIADIDVQQVNAGFEFPKGSNKTAIFESGPIWGAMIAGDPQVRVGGSEYSSGLQPGKILSPGVSEDPDLAKNRIYRVRPDYKTADLSSEINDQGLTATEIRAQYATDWAEWPATDGAPFEDVDSNGVYDPSIDIPGVPGASMTVWFVANDNNAQNTTNLFGTQPMGIECQFTTWAYAQTGALGNMIFKSYLIINKGTQTLDSMFIAQWADPDLGNGEDDFAGCDTSLSLGFIYNGNNTDATYSPLPPPAAGFDFFQGPRVPSTGSTAIFRGKQITGYKSLPMTAFFYFIKSDPLLTDPTLRDPKGATEMYNFMRGRIGQTGQFFVDKQGNPTTYVLTGDPQTGTGWIDGQDYPAGDRRIGLSSGPFTMAPGDTQEIVVGEIAAGAIAGVDRLAAVGLLKFFDKVGQLAYNNNFVLPSAPPAPKLSVTELDQEILLEWGTNASAIEATETSDNHGFKFQGYNVYQLPSASATMSEAKKIATFDIAGDGITRITDQVFDANSGVVNSSVVQLGTDSGIKRYLSVTTDALNGASTLINGIRYYFAVTAYSYSADPNAVPNNLENPLSIVTATPHSTSPGVRYSSGQGDTIKVVTHTGPSDGTVVPIVVDPSKTTGDTYAITFAEDSTGAITWNLTNQETSKEILTGQTNQSGDETYLITDGIQVKVLGPKPGMKDWTIPSGDRRWSWANADMGMEGFSGAMGWGGGNWLGSSTTSAAELRNVLIKFAATDTNGNLLNAGDTLASYAYRYLRHATDPPQVASFAPFIVNASAGYAYQDYTRSIPFAAYDIETTPPTRLMVGYLENNVAGGTVDGKYWPPETDMEIDNTSADGPREWFFIFNVAYSESPDASLKVDVLNTDVPMMWFGSPTRRGIGVALEAGDEFEILANHVNSPSDAFTFTAPTVTSDKTLAKSDINKVNVFPNPYYGVNTEELNKYNRFVTFTHLPTRAIIKIFNLAGIKVRELRKDDASQFQRWDLANESGLPVGSGLYIVHIEMPDLDGATRILKVAIIQEQQILDRY